MTIDTKALRMDAYYYRFSNTGAPEIDLVLSAVACAGKAYHHTAEWNDETKPYPGHEGNTPVDWIRNAADKAADRLAALEAENQRLREILKQARSRIDSADDDLSAWITNGPDPAGETVDERITGVRYELDSMLVEVDSALAAGGVHD